MLADDDLDREGDADADNELDKLPVAVFVGDGVGVCEGIARHNASHWSQPRDADCVPLPL